MSSTPSSVSVPPEEVALTPLFTIVTVVRNAEDCIAAAIESVAAQSCTDYEYLIIDGASSDRTLSLAQAYQNRFAPGQYRIFSEPDAGIYDAMNKGLIRARGDYIAFLGADDVLEPSALARVVEALAASDACDVLVGAYNVIDIDGHVAKRLPQPELIRQRFPRSLPAVHQAFFMRTSLLREVGGFDTTYRIAADYELFLRLLPLHLDWCFTRDVLVSFRLGGTSYVIKETAREYRAAKRRQGESAVGANLVYARNLAAALLVRSLRRSSF